MQYLFPLIALLVLTSCASNYHLTEPLTLSFDQPQDVQNGQAKISYRYNVLKEAGNRKYAKKEKQSGVSLLALRIENVGTDTLFFPGDFYVMAGRDSLYLLTSDEAGEALRQTTAEDSGNGAVEVDAPLLNATKDIFNAATQVKANLRFAKELEEFYLFPCLVAPGVSRVGLQAMEVTAGKPLTFGLYK
ncbi:MAG: hypothetical protein R2788_10730 [Saprospiraceae bacterium]